MKAMVKSCDKRNVMFSILLALGFFLTSGIMVYASGSQPANPVYNSNTDATKWSYVYFGRYPQSEVVGDYLTDEIVNGYYNSTNDTVVKGVKYRRVESSNSNTYKYYRFDPIKWKVLKVDDNSLLLLSDKILATTGYSEDSQYSVSSCRSWLNGYDGSENSYHHDFSVKGSSFIDQAFYYDEKDTMDFLSAGGCSDQIVIPESSIITNSDYGFMASYENSYTRQFKETDYISYIRNNSNYTNCWMYINSSNVLRTVYSNGNPYIYSFGNMCNVPLIKINIHSNLWSMTEPEPSYKTTNITSASVSLSKSVFTYDGTEKKPTAVAVRYNGEKLIQGTDYILKYSNCTNAGTATVSIIGVGDFTGTKNVDYTINKAEQSISVNTNITKSYGDPSFKINAIRKAGNGIYSFVSNNQAVAEVSQYGTVTIKGAGTAKIILDASETTNYYGKRIEITLNVNKVAISKAKVSGISDQTFNGKAWTPTPVVSINGDILTNGTDYVCSYANNINAGTATVTITGLGNYTGKKAATFKINKAAQGLVVKKKTVKTTFNKLKKKKQIVTADVVTKGNSAITKMSYKLVKVNKRKSSFKMTPSGKITIKKATKKGTYKLTIRASAAEGTNYKAAVRNYLVIIKIQ